MKREREFQAWVQISVGCNCAARTASCPPRAGARCRGPAAELVAEVERLAADGVREVTLLGQNVYSYGRDLPKGEKTTFAELLAWSTRSTASSASATRAPTPRTCARTWSAPTPSCRRVCEHIHLPLQSGSSRILKAMRRTYNRERYLDRVAMIRELRARTARSPRTSSSASRARPRPTSRRRSRWSRRWATTRPSRSSSRRGAGPRRRSSTDQVPHEVKRERMERLVEAVQRHAAERAQRFVGRTMEVLVEGPSRTDPARLRGRIRHNKTVNFTGVAAPGELTEVEIGSATSTTLAGERRCGRWLGTAAAAECECRPRGETQRPSSRLAAQRGSQLSQRRPGRQGAPEPHQSRPSTETFRGGPVRRRSSSVGSGRPAPRRHAPPVRRA